MPALVQALQLTVVMALGFGAEFGLVGLHELAEVASLEVHSNGHSEGALPRAVAGLHVGGIVDSAGETVEALGIADTGEVVAGVV